MNKLFESRKSHLDYRIKRDYIRNGAAVIPCKISNFNDVINTYSVKNYEILNQEFVDYIEATAEVIPTEYPLVVDIIEDCLSDEDRKNIEETIDWITFLFDTTPEVFDYIITQPINYKFDYEYE